MEEIDLYLNKLKEKQEIDEFINNGVYPERLSYKNSKQILHFPKMEEEYNSLKSHTIMPIESSFIENLQDMTTKLNDIERKIKINIENENNVSDNDCPICMECMGDRNYIVPICGHKICVKCFVTNISTNRKNGCLCSLCREKIV
jgi:hypothetical protein